MSAQRERSFNYFTPVTCAVVSFLKRAENEDYYDYNTDFNPFAVDLSRPFAAEN